MCRTVNQQTCTDIDGCDHQFTRGLEIAIEPLAHQHLIAARLCNISKPPHRNHSITIIGDNWEKIPIAQHVTGNSIGQIIGSKGKKIDGQSYLALFQRRFRLLLPPPLGKCLSVHFKSLHRWSCPWLMCFINNSPALYRPNQSPRSAVRYASVANALVYSTVFTIALCRSTKHTSYPS